MSRPSPPPPPELRPPSPGSSEGESRPQWKVDVNDILRTAGSPYHAYLRICEVVDSEVEQLRLRDQKLERVEKVARDSRYSDEFVGNIFRAALAEGKQ